MKKTFYRALFDDLKANRDLLWSAAILFAAGAVLGALFPALSHPLFAQFQDIARGLLDLGTGELILAIFARNAAAAGLSMLAGIVFGILPAIASVSNGLLLGLVATMAPGDIWKILPHGIIELPAMFVAWGIGLWLGLWFIGPGRLTRLKHRITAAFRIYVGLILPALAVAAVVEGLAAIFLFGAS